MLEADVKNAIVEVCKILSNKGLAGTYEGNVSYRTEDKIFITPTSQDKARLTSDKLCTLDLDGNQIAGKLSATSEKRLHVAAYKCRPDAHAVVHCHAPYCMAYSLLNRSFETNVIPECMVLFGQVPVVPYGTPGTDAITVGLEECLRDHDITFLANHGIVAVGKDPYEAYAKCQSLEMLLMTLSIAHTFGYPLSELSEDECQKLIEMGKARRGNSSSNV